ncbi:hypothetical protein MCOR25_007180 [Pyricularia grisea]|nr:hypothetical protein MCOR25_007180 [Pyricularia grisea]
MRFSTYLVTAVITLPAAVLTAPTGVVFPGDIASRDICDVQGANTHTLLSRAPRRVELKDECSASGYSPIPEADKATWYQAARDALRDAGIYGGTIIYPPHGAGHSRDSEEHITVRPAKGKLMHVYKDGSYTFGSDV